MTYLFGLDPLLLRYGSMNDASLASTLQPVGAVVFFTLGQTSESLLGGLLIRVYLPQSVFHTLWTSSRSSTTVLNNMSLPNFGESSGVTHGGRHT